jgi:hypothetical protein
MTEETDWIGGQITQQAVPPDENQWIETFGASRSYQNFRERIRQYYFRNYPLIGAARADRFLNPGSCWVSRLGCEPRVALAVLYEILAPYLANGQIQILLRHRAVAASVSGNEVDAVSVVDTESGHKIILHAPCFADATEQGDLLALTKTEYAIGAEAESETHEPHAKPLAQPRNLQGFTCCFAVDYLPGEDYTIDRPRDYAHWRNLTLAGRRVLSFDDPRSKKIGFDPSSRKSQDYWTYRRIADRHLFADGFYPGDISIINWPQNDYSFGRICDVSEHEGRREIERAKQLSLSLLYWLQTEVPRPDGGLGWPGLRLRPDIVGTTDGLAKYPYVREGRRIKAEFTILEQHVTVEARMAATGLSKKEVRAAQFLDSVGIGHYAMDLHFSTAGDESIEAPTLPFQIPLGALLPIRVENILPACKNIGVTHLTNGCYRLHPIEWGIGEAVGALAAFCSAQRRKPREVRKNEGLLTAFQGLLREDGVRLEWPPETYG